MSFDDLDSLISAAKLLSKDEYDKIIVKRTFVDKLCGYPHCTERIDHRTFNNSSAQKNALDSLHSCRQLFCSEQCQKASKILHFQLDDEPVKFRSRPVDRQIFCLPARSKVASAEEFQKALMTVARQLETGARDERFQSAANNNTASELQVNERKSSVFAQTAKGKSAEYDWTSRIPGAVDKKLLDSKKTNSNKNEMSSLSPFSQLYLLADQLLVKRQSSVRNTREDSQDTNEEEDESLLMDEYLESDDPDVFRKQVFSNQLMAYVPELVEVLELKEPVYAIKDLIGNIVLQMRVNEKALACWLCNSLTKWQKLLFIYLLCRSEIQQNDDLLLERSEISADRFEILCRHVDSLLLNN